MADLQKVKSEALATIDSALAILNRYPDIKTANTELSFNTSSNPFDMLLDAFKETAGYNILIKIISKMIIAGIPLLEITVKTILLTNIKKILSCSIDPVISEKLLRDGIVFNLEQIDITDTLKYSPTSKKGQYYYFDNKDEHGALMFVDDLKKSSDFNCLLWFMKNRASHREVWGKKNSRNGSHIEDNYDYWVTKTNDKGKVIGKCRKSAGIVTLQFNERSQSLTNAEGNGMSIQTPYNNCLHVFLGNTQMKDKVINDGKNFSRYGLEEEITGLKREVESSKKAIESYIKLIETYIKNNEDLEHYFVKNVVSRNEIDDKMVCNKEILQEAIRLMKIDVYRNFDTDISNIENEFDNYIKDLEIKYNKAFPTEEWDRASKNIDKVTSVITNAQEKRTNIVNKLKEIVVKEKELLQLSPEYRNITQNYYYDRKLTDFNTDYIMSLRLFDSKVIAAQLIDNLIGISNIDLELSYKQQFIKLEVSRMIKMIIETDSTVVSDCFFTFTNDAYNDMLEKAELNRAKLFSTNGEYNSSTQINTQDILSKINDISDDASQESNISVIEHALTEISDELFLDAELNKKETRVGIKCNFIENLLTNLAYIIAASVLSPKVYLLILINLHILGQEINFTLEEFIGNFKQMIADLMKNIVNNLIRNLMEELMNILKPIALEISVKIGVEQAEYYARLMKKLIECLKSKGKNYDFEVDNVRHADIVSEEIIEKNTEC